MTLTNFTPGSGLLGGMLIGVAAVSLLLGSGRIAGVSGVIAGALGLAPVGDRRWRWFFLGGLVLGASIYSLLSTNSTASTNAGTMLPALLGAVLVGIGTRMGSGCTSGHGICGLSRFSIRSLAATATFMSFGFLTVFVLRHLL